MIGNVSKKILKLNVLITFFLGLLLVSSCSKEVDSMLYPPNQDIGDTNIEPQTKASSFINEEASMFVSQSVQQAQRRLLRQRGCFLIAKTSNNRWIIAYYPQAVWIQSTQNVIAYTIQQNGCLIISYGQYDDNGDLCHVYRNRTISSELSSGETISRYRIMRAYNAQFWGSMFEDVQSNWGIDEEVFYIRGLMMHYVNHYVRQGTENCFNFSIDHELDDVEIMKNNFLNILNMTSGSIYTASENTTYKVV